MSSHMLFMQLKLKGKTIKGDSTISGYEGQIELTSMSWGLSSRDRSPKGTAKVETDWNGEALKIEKFMDGSSTTLYGQVDEREGLRSSARSALSKSETDNVAIISMVAVAAVKNGETMQLLMKITLSACRIMSISTKAGASGLAMSLKEDLHLAFTKLEIDYHPAAPENKRAAATNFKFTQNVA